MASSAERSRQFRERNPGYHATWNRKEANRKKRKKYRSKPESRAKEAAYAALRRKRSPMRLAVDVHKAAPCTDCGGRYPAGVMEFDHRSPADKVADVAVMVHKRHPLSLIFAEIAKCVLVCANCHRIRTITRHLDKVLRG